MTLSFTVRIDRNKIAFSSSRQGSETHLPEFMKKILFLYLILFFKDNSTEEAESRFLGIQEMLQYKQYMQQ